MVRFGASFSLFYFRLLIGRLTIHCVFPWGWLYEWKDYLWAYKPDDEYWWMRILGAEITWCRCCEKH